MKQTSRILDKKMKQLKEFFTLAVRRIIQKYDDHVLLKVFPLPVYIF